ncbi:MAG: M14 family metallopeptidase [Gemmatimonadales bacterium]
MTHASARVAGLLLCVLASGLNSVPTCAQNVKSPVELLTRPERSDFRETSTYSDVMSFVERAVAISPRLHLTTLGYSMEGRALPVVVAGDIEEATPEAVHVSGKVRLYIQANIHAGEVCGKEAMLMLLRALAEGEHAEWFDSLIVFIAPTYNADGNERIRLTNRRYQHGPVAGMGQRANAQGLDLNRDNVKLETPEAHSLVSFWKRYDPHVIMDLHTTNGTRHAYRLTYAPPLHPVTDAGITELLRERMLPEVTRALKAEYDWDYYYYGNLPWRGMDAERGWYTFGHEPRYLTNYVGLRNRIGILSEAYSYSTFEERILATLRFVEEIAEYTYRNASTIQAAIARADEASIVGDELALRATFERSPAPVEILMGEVVEERNPYSGEPMLRRLDVRRPEMMPEFGTFQATESERAPVAYVVPSELGAVLEALYDHGVEWRRLEEPRTMAVERFVIDSTTVSEREYQGHRQRTVYGSYESVPLDVPAGAAVVPLDQPLGRLAFLLLEPRSDDGLLNWNFLDDAIEEGAYYPIVRTHSR